MGKVSIHPGHGSLNWRAEGAPIFQEHFQLQAFNLAEQDRFDKNTRFKVQGPTRMVGQKGADTLRRLG